MDGLTYRLDFIDESEEKQLIENLKSLAYQEVRIQGYAAKRTVLHYGYDYNYDGRSIHPADPPPSFLEPLLDKCASAANVPRESFQQFLVARYPAGATIGWHRDAPMFGSPVVGISLGSACTMRFRRKAGSKFERESLQLEPRSLYILDGAARTQWQHSIPPTPDLRYSITMRTLRRKAA
jgi:DNA oxidative demethylase